MSNSRVDAAHTVANNLFAFERSYDATVANGARLIASIAEGRIDADLSAILVQGTMEKVAKSIVAAVDGRREAVEAHKRLEMLRTHIGLTVSWGDGTKPPSGSGEADERHLRAVA